MSSVAPTSVSGPRRRPAHRVDRAELGVAFLLCVIAVAVFVDASTLETTVAQRGPVGPKAVPVLVGGLLMVTAVLLALDVLRGGHGTAESGEDVDLSHGMDWRTLGLLVAVFLGTSLSIPYVGFPIASAALFFGIAAVLGSARWKTDLVVSVVIALVSYLLFSRYLGIGLPPGLLDPIL